jgi:RNA polymerase sigma-70 factor, ECF subfamily
MIELGCPANYPARRATSEMAPLALGQFYRQEYGRIVATLIRLLGDFDLAEEAAQEAFAAAVEQWPRDGAPRNPLAWIIGTARHKAIDRIRRDDRLDEKRREMLRLVIEDLASRPTEEEDGPATDERLRLIFTCCHPALAPDAQVALSLRTLCGLTTEEIARAFLVPARTMAQRLVRAKRKIRTARIPYEIPSQDVLPERLEAVMAVIYLVFNEGYFVTHGRAAIRTDLCAEGIRLGRILRELIPANAESDGLLALMLLHDARRGARVSGDDEIVLLEDQDRTKWNREQIREGLELVDAALRSGPVGPYAIQAAIAAVHAKAAHHTATDWAEIEALYAYLMRIRPSPVIELNHAVAVAMASGPEHGLRIIESLGARGELDDYHLMWAARADLLRRLGRWREAADCYRAALARATAEPERRFLRRRLADVETAALADGSPDDSGVRGAKVKPT